MRMVEPKIVNVVGTLTFPVEFDLQTLSEELDNNKMFVDVKYDGRVTWIQATFSSTKQYVAFYKSGKCSIAGCSDIDVFYETANKLAEFMVNLFELSEPPTIEINNIVTTATLQYQIRLDQLAVKLGLESTEYEPEQFGGLIYRANSAVFIIFATGKFVCTGLQDQEKIDEEMEKLINEIRDVCG